MGNPAWKKFERRVSKDFSTQRTALSGGNSKVTRSDTHHPKLFLECKHNAESAVWSLYMKTKELAQKEKKKPVLCLGKKNHKGYLIVVHCDSVKEVLDILLQDFPKGVVAPKKKRRLSQKELESLVGKLDK